MGGAAGVLGDDATIRAAYVSHGGELSRFALRSLRELRRSGAALLAAGLAVVLWFAVLAPSPPPPRAPREPVAFTLVSAGVDASATLIAHTWGTEVNLVATGLTPGTRYTVVLVGRNGRRVTAGTFIGVSRQPVRCNLNAALLRTDAAELLVTDPRRRQVLRADLT